MIDDLVITGVLPVHEFDEIGGLSIYPNPSNGIVNILLNINDPGDYTVNLFNQNGQLIQKLVDDKHLAVGEHNSWINLEDIPHGVYYCKLLSDTEVITKKLILLK